jgi:hypothetical protein
MKRHSKVAFQLMQRGWSIDDQFEQEETKELATIRFCHWKHKDILVDLLKRLQAHLDDE